MSGFENKLYMYGLINMLTCFCIAALYSVDVKTGPKQMLVMRVPFIHFKLNTTCGKV